MIPRQEYPRPQLKRADWMNLNGEWQFETDPGVSGKERGLHQDGISLSGKILVPFCPESRLSGIAYRDFMPAVCYKRTFVLPEDWRGGIVRLHFGAVDYSCSVFVNGKWVGDHRGGYVSFGLDITAVLRDGENSVTVYAADDTRDPRIPSGKQSNRFESYGCSYTRTTGIWQTVWLEHMPCAHIENLKYYPDTEAPALTIRAELAGSGTLTAEAFYEGRPVGTVRCVSAGGAAQLTLPLSEKHLWEVGHGRLYDLKLTYGDDRVTSYFGLRSVAMADGRFLLNGRSVFQRLVLDQGFYPEGIYTAPEDKDLLADIDRSIACGFNGARLHEKVFEERFLYYCDKRGYLVWGEYPDWGSDTSDPLTVFSILPEWLDEMKRDFNHPAIIGWCPHNETSIGQFDEAIRLAYRATKAADPTRPCIDTSGYVHVETDIYDVHSYEQDPAAFGTEFAGLADGIYTGAYSDRQPYGGQPFFVSEYGGICWSEDATGWGYGNAPKSKEELLSRLRGLTDVLLDNPHIIGLCYTQLTDVEQEQNGLYTYDRTPKFDPAQLAEIFGRKAAVEDA